MKINKVQLNTLIGNHIEREKELHEVMEMMLNAMMKSECCAQLERMSDNKANGYRYGKTYGQDRILELRIPRDRNGSSIRRFWLCCGARKPRLNNLSAPCTARD